MLYYDDRDYYNSDNIDELYDDDEYLFEETDNEDISALKHSWEFDYHSLASELEEDC